MYNILQELLVGAGIQLHEMWSPSDIKILGTPLGSPEVVRSVVEKRLEDEGKLWQAVTWVPDLSVGGKFFCNLQGHDATISSAHCHRVNLPSTLNDTTMWHAMQAHMGGLTGH